MNLRKVPNVVFHKFNTTYQRAAVDDSKITKRKL